MVKAENDILGGGEKEELGLVFELPQLQQVYSQVCCAGTIGTTTTALCQILQYGYKVVSRIVASLLETGLIQSNTERRGKVVQRRYYSARHLNLLQNGQTVPRTSYATIMSSYYSVSRRRGRRDERCIEEDKWDIPLPQPPPLCSIHPSSADNSEGGSKKENALDDSLNTDNNGYGGVYKGKERGDNRAEMGNEYKNEAIEGKKQSISVMNETALNDVKSNDSNDDDGAQSRSSRKRQRQRRGGRGRSPSPGRLHQETGLYKNRRKMALDAVNTEKIVSAKDLRKRIRAKEGGFGILDSRTSVRLFADMEKDGLLKVYELQRQSHTSGTVSVQRFVTLLHPSIDHTDPEVQQTCFHMESATRKIGAYSVQGRDRTGAGAPSSIDLKQVAADMLYRQLLGYVKARNLRAYLLHKHLFRETSMKGRNLSTKEAIDSISVSLYLQICGAPTAATSGLARAVVTDEALHDKRLRDLPPDLRDHFYQRGFKGFFEAYALLRNLGLLSDAAAATTIPSAADAAVKATTPGEVKATRTSHSFGNDGFANPALPPPLSSSSSPSMPPLSPAIVPDVPVSPLLFPSLPSLQSPSLSSPSYPTTTTSSSSSSSTLLTAAITTASTSTAGSEDGGDGSKMIRNPQRQANLFPPPPPPPPSARSEDVAPNSSISSTCGGPTTSSSSSTLAMQHCIQIHDSAKIGSSDRIIPISDLKALDFYWATLRMHTMQHHHQQQQQNNNAKEGGGREGSQEEEDFPSVTKFPDLYRNANWVYRSRNYRTKKSKEALAKMNPDIHVSVQDVVRCARDNGLSATVVAVDFAMKLLPFVAKFDMETGFLNRNFTHLLHKFRRRSSRKGRGKRKGRTEDAHSNSNDDGDFTNNTDKGGGERNIYRRNTSSSSVEFIFTSPGRSSSHRKKRRTGRSNPSKPTINNGVDDSAERRRRGSKRRGGMGANSKSVVSSPSSSVRFNKAGRVAQRRRPFDDRKWKRHQNAQLLAMYNLWLKAGYSGVTNKSAVSFISAALELEEKETAHRVTRIARATNNRKALRNTLNVLSHHQAVIGHGHHIIPHPPPSSIPPPPKTSASKTSASKEKGGMKDVVTKCGQQREKQGGAEAGGEEEKDLAVKEDEIVRAALAEVAEASRQRAHASRIEAAANMLKVVVFQDATRYHKPAASLILEQFTSEEMTAALAQLHRRRYISKTRATQSEDGRSFKIHKGIQESIRCSTYPHSLFEEASKYRSKVSNLIHHHQDSKQQLTTCQRRKRKEPITTDKGAQTKKSKLWERTRTEIMKEEGEEEEEEEEDDDDNDDDNAEEEEEEEEEEDEDELSNIILPLSTSQKGELAGFFGMAAEGRFDVIPALEYSGGLKKLSNEDQAARSAALEASVQIAASSSLLSSLQHLSQSSSSSSSSLLSSSSSDLLALSSSSPSSPPSNYKQHHDLLVAKVECVIEAAGESGARFGQLLEMVHRLLLLRKEKSSSSSSSSSSREINESKNKKNITIKNDYKIEEEEEEKQEYGANDDGRYKRSAAETKQPSEGDNIHSSAIMIEAAHTTMQRRRKSKEILRLILEELERRRRIFAVSYDAFVSYKHSDIWTLRLQASSVKVPVRSWNILTRDCHIAMNEEVLAKTRHAILSLVLCFPGISVTEIHYRISFLQNSELNIILGRLQEEKKVVIRSTNFGQPSLFSSCKETLNGGDESRHVFPTSRSL